MTKKRFRLSMAALGLLAAFFMMLVALLLAPTLASADKNSGAPHHQGGKPGVPPHGGLGATSGGSIFADNWLGHDHGHASDTPFCAKGIMPCPDAGDGQDDFGGAIGPSSGYGGDSSGGNGQAGGGSSKGDGFYASNFWGGGGGNGGGNGSGGNGGGAGDGNGGGDHDGDGGHDGDKGGDKTCTNPGGDKAHTCDAGPEILTLDIPGDLPPDFVDPSFGDDPKDGGNNPGDGPKGENPPITRLTESPTEIPEPLTVSIFAAGLAGAAGLRRRSQSRRS